MRALFAMLWLPFVACIDTQRTAPTKDVTDTTDTADTTDTCTVASRCSDDRRRIETCSQSIWSTTATCSAAQLCVDVNGPYCIPASGDRFCYDQLHCAAACRASSSTPVEECVTLCFADTKAAEQTALLAASDCFTHQCATACTTQGIQPDTVECYDTIFDCVAANCSDELAACDFGTQTFGTRPCDNIRSCGRDCQRGSASDQSTCTIECVQEGDSDAQRLYAVMDLCESFVCAEAPDKCQTAGALYCANYILACQNDD